MKRLLMLLGISFLLFSCASQNNRTRNPDFLADMDPVSIGSVPMQFEKFLSSVIEKKDVEVWFDPRIDSVYLQYRYQTGTFRQYWNKSGRLQFITALEKYKKDYEARNLNLKGARALRAYGITGGRTIWGQFSSNVFMNAEALPKIELGYQFKQDSPYFTVHYGSAENIRSTDHQKETSLGMIAYFTRTQADELAKLFDQQYLLSFLGPRPDPGYAAPAQEDDYAGYREAGTGEE
ncbi:hypothetical protein FACS189450_12890 [Spirochaetia bacterium]|nr:hypothetical protein FACS189450_12890 [Spirochaetia bacterium]